MLSNATVPRSWRFKVASRGAVVRLSLLLMALVIAGVISHRVMIVMPGRSFSGPLPAATERERLVAASIERDVQRLAGEIGSRNRTRPTAYRAAADHIASRLRSMGYEPVRQPTPPDDPGATPGNIIVEITGSTPEIIIVGAHYDSFDDSPGANDNATGVASVLSLAEAFVDAQPKRTLRFVFFADEEPPHFQTEGMGSLTFARACREAGERIAGMISVETIGWYSEQRGSQKYPAPLGAFYPDTGDFIGFVANPRSRVFLREVIASFRATTDFPSEGGALPGALPGIGWSDHWAFWQEGFAALMVTDSAPYRYPYYHTTEDTPDKVDFDRMARVTMGLERVIRRLVGA